MHHRGPRRPKIAELLGRPESVGVLEELRLCRRLGIPPSRFRGRVLQVSYLYDDPDHPDRVTGTLSTPEWTESDRAALLGLEAYETTVCPGCGEPKQIAWHAYSDEEYKAAHVVCHSCTAREGSQQVYHRITHRPRRVEQYPPFVFGETTTEPNPPKPPS